MLPVLLAAVLAATPSDTLPVPHRFLAAIEAGTRTRTGVPGPRYWQQRVSYQIRTRLHPEETKVTGWERITYENRSPDTLGAIALNLSQNVFAPGNPRNRAVPITGGFDLERIVVQGAQVSLASAEGRSLPPSEAVPLPQPLPPGGTAELEIAWSFLVPEGAFRMGRDGKEVFYLAQWYPQVAVYDDLRGWIRDPYLGNGEFYLEYGDFDVEVTAPAGWLVSATGVLQNAAEVLAPQAVERLRSLSRDRITHVVSHADAAAGRATAVGGTDGTLTWRFRAENVRDFAWGTSNRYVWDGTVAAYRNDDGTTRSSAIYTLYRPDRPNWERSAEFARHAIETHSGWYPYPYPHMTVNEGVIGGGMEYPMITIIGGGRTPESLYGVTTHEIAHMWWPMVAGSDERNDAWIDEGFASLSEDMASELFFPGTEAGLFTMNGYLRVAGSDDETPSLRPTDEVGPFGNRGLAAYGKPATVFRALRTVLGPTAFDEAMRAYIRRWAYKHPKPLDLFWTFEDVTKQDLDWFFYPWLYTTRVMDQAVARVEQGSGSAVVVLEERGEIPMPAIVEVVTDTGHRSRRMMPVGAWEGRTARVRVTAPGRVVEVVLDPEQRFPDVNREDNRWTAR
ncbi:MAG: M1 family metallopeptidase [Gemmatimonadetes bacterium]|nr:M1 family metallopeptidase [Gemmatimonadota bacterium]